MHIYATKKLMKGFKKAEKMATEPIEHVTFLEDSESPDGHSFFDWHANIAEMGTDECLIMTHDRSGLTLIFLNVYEEELMEFYDWFEEAFYDLLGKLGFSHHSIQRYLTDSNGYGITISKATDSKKIGRNSSVINLMRKMNYYQEDDFIVQGYWQYQISRLNTSLKRGERSFEHFINEYEEVIGPVTYAVDMVEFEIRLRMEMLPDVIRIVQMPMYLTFEDLHQVIQTIYMWQHMHLHQFILEDGSTIIGAEQKYNMEQYQMGGNQEAYTASQLKLADVITPEENGVITYVYDFGDSWEHSIRARKFYSEKKRMFPKLTLMSGDPVPENVGGPPGYQYFLEVINDPVHDEHSVIKEWSKDYLSRLNIYNDVNHFNHEIKRMHT
ncbi:plasmid pRiA4b ORF-3 family protein [Alkalibacterium sp. f15]|uniref:plasmid pRiA4b ORF-3 family protein n=1 Tax=Alkalibacterium sp. f15 TaxID=3414029 RepID=UPI003BF85279